MRNGRHKPCFKKKHIPALPDLCLGADFIFKPVNYQRWRIMSQTRKIMRPVSSMMRVAFFSVFKGTACAVWFGLPDFWSSFAVPGVWVRLSALSAPTLSPQLHCGAGRETQTGPAGPAEGMWWLSQPWPTYRFCTGTTISIRGVIFFTEIDKPI